MTDEDLRLWAFEKVCEQCQSEFLTMPEKASRAEELVKWVKGTVSTGNE